MQLHALLFEEARVDTRLRRHVAPKAVFSGRVQVHPQIPTDITGLKAIESTHYPPFSPTFSSASELIEM